MSRAMPNALRSLLVGLIAFALLFGIVAARAEALPQVSLDIALDPGSGSLEGEMTLVPPPASNGFTLLPGLELVAAQADGDAIAAEADDDGRHRLAWPSGTESLTLRWQGRLEDGERLLVSPGGSLLPCSTNG